MSRGTKLRNLKVKEVFRNLIENLQGYFQKSQLFKCFTKIRNLLNKFLHLSSYLKKIFPCDHEILKNSYGFLVTKEQKTFKNGTKISNHL